MKYINIIIIISLIIIKIKSTETSKRYLLDDCNKYSDCFNCSICGKSKENFCECTWRKNSCVSSSNNPITLDWRNNFESCDDLSSIQIQNKYCGEIQYKNKKKKGYLEFPKVNEYYGKSNLFCLYKFDNDYSSASYKIKTIFNGKFTSNSNRVLVSYKINFKNGNSESEYKSINSNIEELIYDEVKNIEIYIFSSMLYYESPFEISIIYQSNNIFKSIYIIIAIIIFLIIICSISIYCCTRKLNIEIINREEEVIRRISQSVIESNQAQEIQEIQQQMIVKNVENLLNNPNLLGERICKKEYEKYGTKCTICLEELKVGIDKVSLTPCFHVFHYKCLSDWLRKNTSNLKCPNCNFDLNKDNFKENLKKNNNDINKEIDNLNNNNIENKI